MTTHDNYNRRNSSSTVPYTIHINQSYPAPDTFSYYDHRSTPNQEHIYNQNQEHDNQFNNINRARRHSYEHNTYSHRQLGPGYSQQEEVFGQSSLESRDSRPHEFNFMSSSVPTLSREFVVRRISEGESGRLKEELKCEACGKGYKHISSLAKHLWEHTPEWNVTKKLLISKHQQVQLLEAASILVGMNELTSRRNSILNEDEKPPASRSREPEDLSSTRGSPGNNRAESDSNK